VRGSFPRKKTAHKVKVAFLAAGVVAAAGVVFYFGTASYAVRAGRAPSATQPQASKTVPKSLSLPMFFEPNQGQTAPQVKFLARGSGYGLFLTSDEAVLQLQPSVPNPRTVNEPVQQVKPSAVIRMRLEGANKSALVSGDSPLPGKSNYFIGIDPSKWQHDIPQFARVQYEAVYPGVDLVYYGNRGQLEYDFRVAPGAKPDQIALSFTGASAHLASDDSGDLVLSTGNGDIRFHAPHVYQPAIAGSANLSSNVEKAVTGSFRQLADNKIGFSIGDYDRSRELVIDPLLSYSTYLGAGGEGLVKVAVDNAGNIYLAGSTTSAYFFPIPTNNLNPPPPLQTQLGGPGAQNIFIAEINPMPQTGFPQLLYATYLGGSGIDSLAGIAVDLSHNIYVAGTTTSSSDFPLSTGTNGTLTPFQSKTLNAEAHGFLSAIELGGNPETPTYTLAYSTYLSGDGSDTVTGLAIGNNNCHPTCNAYVTGVTTSQIGINNGFPANASAYQKSSNSPGNKQFFASELATSLSGPSSMIYSTYFGGGNFGTQDIAYGGGIAVDPSATNPNMYFTVTTNMLGIPSGSLAAFPLFNAQQSCLNQASTTNCITQTATTTTDAFVAKINPNQPGAFPLYSTYLGGSDSDYGNGISVDTSGNAYVVGTTSSPDWVEVGGGFQTTYKGVPGSSNAFIVRLGNNLTGAEYPINYFTYLGGSGPDLGEDIRVDATGDAYVVGTTSSNVVLLPVTQNTLQATYGGGNSDAFFALIALGTAGQGSGDYVSYLGGSGTDQGTGIAFDVFGSAYVAGSTQSADFPITKTTAYQPNLIGTQDAFVSKIGANSGITLTVPLTSPAPNPDAAGTQVVFTFNITNAGPDNANQVSFNALGVPSSPEVTGAHATVSMGTGSCNPIQGTTINCQIGNLAVGGMAQVQVDMTPVTPVLNSTITISGNVSANGGGIIATASQPIVNITDFNVSAVVLTPTVNAGDTAKIQVKFCPTPQSMPYGYNGTITPSATENPSMVTSPAPSFNPTSVTLAGTSCGTTTLSLPTVARPITSSSVRHRSNWFYALWLPVGGVSLLGLGIGAGRKRRWLMGALLGLIAAIILLQPGCGSASSSTPVQTGTAAGTYTVTITGAAGTSASHQTSVPVTVN
jgi:hypothetical protein